MNLKKLLFITLLSTATLFAGFTNVHCDNEGNLTVLKIPQGECEALDAIWDAMGNGEEWTNKTNWDTVTYAGEWFGITLTDDNTSMKILDLSRNNLMGEVPIEIGNFTNLEKLALSYNKLFGRFPSEVTQLSMLKIMFLGYNNFTGNIPPEIMNMPLLEIMNLSDNDLVGTIPEIISLPKLKYISLHSNQLTDTIPQSFDKLTNIIGIILYDNNLSGTLPDFSNRSPLPSMAIYGNHYTFSEIEPLMVWLDPYGTYAPQKKVDTNGRKVYFQDRLEIVPEILENSSGNDVYRWKKDGIYIDSADGKRVYVKENASSEDNGVYVYKVTNPNVTLYPGQYFDRYNLTLSSNLIHAIYNNKPTLSNKTPQTQTTENEPYTYTSDISDADTSDTLTVTSTTLPAWLTLTPEANNFTLSGTPTSTDIGSHDINITVTDGKIPVHINYVLVVKVQSQQNNAPTITGTPSTEVNAGEAYTFTPTSSDTDGDTLRYTITNQPNWATFDTTTGTLTGTPQESDVNSYGNISIKVSDSLEIASLPAFNINVKSLIIPNTTPTITGTPSTEVNAEETYTFSPTATDAEGDTLSYSITNKPDWAMFSTVTGELTGTPQESDVKSYQNIIITVSDSKATASLLAFNLEVKTAGSVTPPPVKSSSGGVSLLGFGLLFVLLLVFVVGRERKVVHGQTRLVRI